MGRRTKEVTTYDDSVLNLLLLLELFYFSFPPRTWVAIRCIKLTVLIQHNPIVLQVIKELLHVSLFIVELGSLLVVREVYQVIHT